MYLADMDRRIFEIPLRGARPVRFHSAGFLDDAGGHLHIERARLHKLEIQVVEHGVLYLEVDGVELAAGPGSVIFMPAGVHQRGYRRTTGRIRYVWLHFDAEVVEVAGAGEEVLERTRETVREQRPLVRAVVPLHLQVTSCADVAMIARFIAARSAAVEPEKSSLITALLCVLTRTFVGSDTTAPPGTSHRRAQDIGAYIHQMAINSEQVKNLSPGSVAEHFGANPIYLNRVFRAHTGTTIGHQIIFERIAHARYLLSVGFSVKEAARDCGYSNTKYFARQFKAHTGVVPSQARSAA